MNSVAFCAYPGLSSVNRKNLVVPGKLPLAILSSVVGQAAYLPPREVLVDRPSRKPNRGLTASFVVTTLRLVFTPRSLACYQPEQFQGLE